MNKALLAQQAWKIITSNDSSLIGREVKYQKSILEGNCKAKASYSWILKDVLKVSFLIVDNLKWQVGNESNIPNSHVKWFTLCSNGGNSNLTVAKLVDKDHAIWNEQLISSLYCRNIRDDILRTPIFFFDQNYFLIWTKANDRVYSVKKGFSSLIMAEHNLSLSSAQGVNRKEYRKIELPFRVILFSWKIINETIPTPDILKKHHLQSEGCFVICGNEEETANHIFIHCDLARAMWFSSSLSIRTEGVPNVRSFIIGCINKVATDKDWLNQLKEILLAVQALWECRNRKKN